MFKLKPFLFLACFSLLCSLGNAQNIVPNFSFAQFDTCPNYASQTHYAIPWFNPTLGTSDYFNACDTLWGEIDVPKNWIGYQNAKTGVEYAGFMTTEDPRFNWQLNWREYVAVKLTSPLINGTTYFVHFFVSLADSSNYATDDVGAFFSKDSIYNDTSYILPFIPQVANPSGKFLTDTANWVMISGKFTAQGGEQYMYIGNFKGYQNMDTLSVLGGGDKNFYNFPYYYVDDVCVSTDSLICNILTGIKENKLQNHLFSFYQSGNSLTFIFDNGLSINSSYLAIYDVLGRQLRKISIGSRQLTVDKNGLSQGIYFFRINYSNQIFTQKLFIY